MNDREQIEAYRQLMGDEATARQIIEAHNRYKCCFEYVREGHHPDCVNHPAKRARKTLRKYEGDTATERAR